MLKSLVKSGFLVAALALGGCGVDDVQLNGKIFDAVGLNTGSIKKKAVTLKERPPLVMPPGLESLPAPGSGKVDAAQNDIQGLVDHDAKKQTSQAELERQQAEYCKKNYEDAKVRGDENADLAEGPLGPCRGSVFTALKKLSGGDAEEEQ